MDSAEQKWILHSFLILNESIKLGTTNISVQGFHNGVDKEKKINVTSKAKRRRLKILLHMGLLTKEYGLNFGESALLGGPLGELVQWADLMSALHVLGHDVILSWGPKTLQNIVLPHKLEIQKCQPARTVDLIFTDITGLEQVRITQYFVLILVFCHSRNLHGSTVWFRLSSKVQETNTATKQRNAVMGLTELR